jgi:N-acetylglutamate synthase-like GNAT family acetyltransferase
LAIEQTRDLAQVVRMLSAAAMPTDGVEAPGGCYLMAYVGDEVAGAVGIEARVEVALMRSLIVIESMRRRGIGAALVSAARTAAHTRGARTLYTIAPDERVARYFGALGFKPAASEELPRALTGAFAADRLDEHPGEVRRWRTLSLDLSNDGLIQR